MSHDPSLSGEIPAPAPSPTLPLLPEPPAGRPLRLTTACFLGRINPKEFRAANPHYAVLAADPLLIEPQRGCYAVLPKFGTVVFWNCDDATRDQLLREIDALRGTVRRDDRFEDTLDIHLGADRDHVTFNDVHLRRLTLDRLKLVSMALAISVALERFEHETIEALARFDPVMRDLRERGRVALPNRRLLQTVGFALEVRSAVITNVTAMTNIAEVWVDERLAALDARLRDHFDLAERFAALNQNVAFLTDMNSILLEVLANRKAHRLEWIIIILIAVEIVASLGPKALALTLDLLGAGG